MTMKRKVDDLGRIALPKEVRKELQIKEGDTLEINVEEDKIILERYFPDCSQEIEALIEKISKDSNDFPLTDDEYKKRQWVEDKLSDIVISLKMGLWASTYDEEESEDDEEDLILD